ncbi:hypothetical protein phiK7B1_094 [Pseudomonas phage phiK7B1]|nr:hypothetical protein phiK7B1_094 [Pseudomonas phage phiK7B1]
MTDEYSLDDELTRKAGEAALWLDNEVNRGAVTRPQAYTALVVFDLITAGLIDPKFQDWSRDTRSLIRTKYADKVVMHAYNSGGKETVIAVELDRANAKVTCTQLTRNPEFTAKVHTFDDETDPVTAACEGYLDIIERLKSKGCVVVA